MQSFPEVDILSVVNAHQIGVRLKSENERYHRFVDELKTWFGNNKHHQLQSFEEHSICVFKSPTSWHRAIIISQKVFFVSHNTVWS